MGNGKETRHQRREREREQIKTRAKLDRTNPLVSRRGIIFKALGTAGVATAAVIATCTEPGQRLVNNLFGPAELSSQEKRLLVQQEIKRLGIKQNQEEIALWRDNSFFPPSIPFPIEDNKETNKLFFDRIDRTVNLMAHSKNPYFKEAAEFAQRLYDAGEFEFHKNLTTERRGNKVLGLNTQYGIFGKDESKKFGWVINASADEVINKIESLTLAIWLVHELDHVRDMYMQDLPQRSLTPEERLDSLNAHLSSVNNRIMQESRGYAKQSQTFIYQAGLYGNFPEGTNLDVAAAYVDSGKDTASQKWIDYLKRNGHLQGVLSQ